MFVEKIESGVIRAVLASGILVGAAMVAAGCSEREVPARVPVKTSDAVAQNSAGGDAIQDSAGADVVQNAAGGSVGAERKTYGEFRFLVPAGWEEVPLTPMQQGFVTAKLGVPEVSEELSISLSTSGGSVEDNIERWRGQFSGGGSDTDTIRVTGLDAPMVDLHGAYQGMGAGSRDGWRMIGVIVPLAATSNHYFIKLTGPADSVEKIKDDFIAFVKSAESN